MYNTNLKMKQNKQHNNKKSVMKNKDKSKKIWRKK